MAPPSAPPPLLPPPPAPPQPAPPPEQSQAPELDEFDRDVAEILHERSAHADVVFLGLMIPSYGDEIRYAERLEQLAEGFKTTIFVRNAGRFAGDLL